MPDFDPKVNKSAGASPGQFAGIGLQFTVAILLFLFIGQWLDKKFGTTPIFLIGCVFVGAGAAFYSMYRKLMAINAAEDEMRKKK